MAVIFLNLKQVNPFGRMLSAVCAISGPPGSLHGVARTFIDINDLTDAFESAGIAHPRYATPLTAVRSGYGCFLEISETEAHRLNLLQG